MVVTTWRAHCCYMALAWDGTGTVVIVRLSCGCYASVTWQVFGANPLLWPLPISRPTGDGIHYPLNPNVTINPGKRRVMRTPHPQTSFDVSEQHDAAYVKGGSRAMRCAL